ncbi:MAG: phosphoribosylglycinamide formyltransferase [Hyphomicrobiales bacterium]|nr:phosphoribosylglycinamide formyltransferase [Hyphomicrobiales bacterium]
MPRKRTSVLISGRGTNMAALIEAARGADYPAEIVLVISNIRDAPGLARAASFKIPTKLIEHRPFGKDREGFEQALDCELAAHGVELVCLAGFMRRLTPWFVRRWEGRLLNIHPSLLPAFKGLHTHSRALAEAARLHGASVHFVTEGVDEGPVIAQSAVPVLPGDTEEVLAARVLDVEGPLYVASLRFVASGEARLESGRVTFGK